MRDSVMFMEEDSADTHASVHGAAKRERVPPSPPPPPRSGSAQLQAVGEATRDLQITGVTRKDDSWQYHIEVLDVRASRQDSARARQPLPVTTNASAGTGRVEDILEGPGQEADAVQPDATECYPELPPMVRYTVMRRYTDFRQLYTFLVDTHGAALRDALPKFPDGGWLSYLRGDDPRLLHHRRKRLQRFLRAVDARPDLRWSAAFTDFLRPDLQELHSSSGASFTATASSASDLEMLASTHTRPPLSLPPSHGKKPSLSASASASCAEAGGGYVSLSQLKSPEIRFRKKVTPGSTTVNVDARGDWKRRRLHLHSQDADEDAAERKPSAKKQLALALSGALGFKRFVVGVGSGVISSLGRIGGDRDDDDDDDEEEGNESESDTDDDTDGARLSAGGATDGNGGRSAELLKLLGSSGH